MRETLAGIRVIRAFVRTRHEEERFDEASLDLFGTAIRVNRLFAVTIPVLTLIVNLSTVAVVWFGAMRVDSGAMPIGNLTAFLQYLSLILFSVLQAVIMFIFVPARRGLGGSHRRGPRRPTRPCDRSAAASRPWPTTGALGLVEFRDVEFRYPGAEEPVLRGVSFIARPGQTTAIVGSTGSGKTTLVNLLPAVRRT